MKVKGGVEIEADQCYTTQGSLIDFALILILNICLPPCIKGIGLFSRSEWELRIVPGDTVLVGKCVNQSLRCSFSPSSQRECRYICVCDIQSASLKYSRELHSYSPSFQFLKYFFCPHVWSSFQFGYEIRFEISLSNLSV